MKKITYHKLVRDKIPEIIAQAGNSCRVKTLSEEDYLKQLDLKLDEETAEYQQSNSIEELADILEVVYAIAEARGSSAEEVEAIRSIKAANRGGFRKRILLEDVTEM
jgi:predicted house-cleaning noncanonical NTP pyrophosphatase (MazG superfamily)